MASKKQRQDIESAWEAKRNATFQSLFRTARLIQESVIAAIRERTGKPVRYAHATLLPHVDMEGTRQTVIAERLGISKQAVGQLVDDLEAMDFLVRLPAPDDGRAKLVCFNRKAKFGFVETMDVIGELEDKLVKQIGKREMKAFLITLRKILTVVEEGQLS